MRWFPVLLALLSCSASATRSTTEPTEAGRAARANGPWPLLSEQISIPSARFAGPGEDDGTTSAMVRSLVDSTLAPWEHIEPPEGAHPLVCDVAWFDEALWVAFGDKTISTDGAQVHSWTPERGWNLEFNWDRGGAPGVTHEQGGQGIARLRVIGGALYATDADAPNLGGFGISDAPLEGYVFVAGNQGFGELLADQRPPLETLIVPLAFHVFDITNFKGQLIASGGALAPEGAKSKYPGGLFVQNEEGQLWPRHLPGVDVRAGVVRATFMHRFRGRLYVGFQNNENRMRWDLGVLDEAAGDLVLGRATDAGGWKTRHFASDAQSLYWLASNARGGGENSLFRSADGRKFSEIAMPEGAGEPQDLITTDGRGLLLADGGLYRLGVAGVGRRVLASPPGKPFERRDGFCAAPVLATPLGLVTGSTNGLGLYRAKVVAPTEADR